MNPTDTARRSQRESTGRATPTGERVRVHWHAVAYANKLRANGHVAPIRNYYMAQVFFLPIFGVTVWLLMSSFAHVVLRVAGQGSKFGLVLNIVGIGMLIPMPVTWAWDVTMVALHLYLLPVIAISHSIIQLWEASIETIGFITLLRLKILPAIMLALVINAIYIALAMIFIR